MFETLAHAPLLALLFALAPAVLVRLAVDVVAVLRGHPSVFEPPVMVSLRANLALIEALQKPTDKSVRRTCDGNPVAQPPAERP